MRGNGRRSSVAKRLGRSGDLPPLDELRKGVLEASDLAEEAQSVILLHFAARLFG
jgi:hypothetical protein